MQNKRTPRKWHDIEMFISAASIAITVGLWSWFSAPKTSAVDGVQDSTGLTDKSNAAGVVAITPAPPLLPGQVLLLGNALPVTPSVTAAPTIPAPVLRRGKSGGPVTTTHSSHP